MNRGLVTFFFCMFCALMSAQVDVDSLEVITKDSTIEEVYITNEKLSLEEIESRKQFLFLRNRVFRTYPFAKTASERLELLNQNLAKLTKKRDRKK